MGTTLEGTNPSGTAGEFFSHGRAWLMTLAEYLQDLNRQEVYPDYNLWQHNQGSPASQTECSQLAAMVRADLNREGPDHWARKNGAPWIFDPEELIYRAGNPPGLFSTQEVENFCAFLEACGGFTVS